MSLNMSAPCSIVIFNTCKKKKQTNSGANKNVQMPYPEWYTEENLNYSGPSALTCTQRQAANHSSEPKHGTLNTFLVLLYGVTSVPKILTTPNNF